MKYAFHTLLADVMARLGEIARPQIMSQSQTGMSDVPWPEDIIGLKVKSLLPEIGAGLIREASVGLSGCQVFGSSGCQVLMKEMPCGLYSAEVRLPEGFLRLLSVKMSGWRDCVCSLILPEMSDWKRQWSPHPGIAGCPEWPRAYLDIDVDGMLLRLVGSVTGEDSLEWLQVLTVPEVDALGEFDFPEALYPELVGAIAGSAWFCHKDSSPS